VLQHFIDTGISNFPSETIQKHLEFCWRGTMQEMKEHAETYCVKTAQPAKLHHNKNRKIYCHID
jgi:hypothetical protein